MKAKLNYILGGILALAFSLVASTGVLMLYEGAHSSGFLALCLHAALPLMRKVHIIVGLILIALVAYHVIRNWDFIVCMTEVIRQEREAQGSPSEEEAGSGEGEPEDYEEVDQEDYDGKSTSCDDEPSDDDSEEGREESSGR
jgi:hypothetical protein